MMRYNHSRSSKVNDFRVIWKGVCHFLLVINSNRPYLLPFPRYGRFSIEFLTTRVFYLQFENVPLALDG